MSTLRLLALAAAALGFAASLNLSLAERALGRPYDVAVVPSSSVARIAALGHRTLVADLYWLAAVQYIGEPRADERGWDRLFPIVDLVTDLDPRHGYAYQTAGIVLSSVGRLDESNRILEKGIAKGPPYWTFPYYISFNHWFFRGDYETGARYARLAARTPGASPNVSHLAVSLSSKSGTPADAIAMLEEMRSTVKDEATASRLDEQMRLAVLERDAQLLERAVERFRVEHGRDVFALDELVLFGAVRAIPPDPFGGTYVWDPGDRKVYSSLNRFRFPPRDAPQAPAGVPVDPRGTHPLRRTPE